MAISEIKVSVIMSSYNHEGYIRQALDSVIMQRTNFKYEILVGDDASQDGTPEILKEYSLVYPDILRVFLRERNLGVSRNAYELTTQARGEYIASLDGDDFWTDIDKLQIQADFLDRHSEFIGCVHEYETVNEEGLPLRKKRISWISEKKVFTLKDFKGVILPGHPSTTMKRNIFKNPKYDYSIVYEAHPMICDRTGVLLYLSQGNFYKIGRCMGVCRYIRKRSGDNLTSKLYCSDEQHLYSDFLYTCKLQRYAKDILHVDAGFEVRKRELFAGVVCRCLLKFDKESFRIVKEILGSADSVTLYLLALPYNVLRKLYIKFIYR